LSTDQSERLKAALAEIQKRWGNDALRPLSSVRASSAFIPTGFYELDTLLRGGIPLGYATELSGVPTSGKTTLAFKIITQAQAQGRPTVYIDLASTFNPNYAAQCGIQLDRLLIARPQEISRGLDIMHVVAMEADAGLVVFDPGARLSAAPFQVVKLNTALRRILPALKQSRSAVIILNSSTDPQRAASLVGLRIQIENVGWVEGEGDVSGVKARLTILKGRQIRPERHVELTVSLDDPVQKDTV
jgi:recombination protein RecA